jgi:SAM-dependent methyltransferase
MAVTILNALFFAECWREGVSFNSTLTLGRLDCYMWSRDLQRIARLLPNKSKLVESVRRGEVPTYMDDLFRAMGASRVDAMDASDFEGATILQDLNEPLAAHLHSQYDAVVDTGTLEHVFNVPAAFKNVMDALKVGGDFLGTLPANNYCGHGFYQFSAEFVYRVFSGQNGFEIRKLFIAPAYVAGKWLDGPVFEVLDPEEVRGRVQIEGRRKMVFLVQARKVRQEAVFATWPQQSDYSAVWSRGSACQPQQDADLTMFESAVRTYRKIISRIKGVQRLSERIEERRVWTRQCVKNSALMPHKWID